MGVRHVALFRFAEGITPAQVQAIDQGLAALPAAIPEIREYRFGIDLGLVERNADYAIVGDFATLEDYIAYRDHPDHRAFIDSCMEGVVTERLAVQYEA
ncbi:MAG TPA: Dabb family protein [Acidimicrobiales bacterium]|nr:Dabb family protein [Acidimicrobiales bacterium]